MNQIELIRKLRSAREICGISQEEAAAAIAAPRTAIVLVNTLSKTLKVVACCRLISHPLRMRLFLLLSCNK